MLLLAAIVVGGLFYLASSSDDSTGAQSPAQAVNTTEAASEPVDRTPIEETIEYIRSNEACPSDLVEFSSLPVANFGIGLEHVVERENLTVMAFADADNAVIGSRVGEIWTFGPDGISAEPVLDLSDDTSAEDDQGLLGVTFSPDGAWMYLNHTNGDGDNVIRAYPYSEGQLDAGGEVEVIVVDQPTRQHNGGSLAFGPDGYLYVSFGDGGGLGDPRHHGQDLGTILGSIVRLDVDPTATPAYRAAPGNPYIGDEGRNDLIWAAGVRNPFRLSFDRVQGDLWVADVGQQCVEEVSVLKMGDGGANLGWNVYEGTRRFVGDPLRDHHEPVYEYKHGRGRCAIVGGYVYRGPSFPQLLGRFVFSDLCSGGLYALSPGGTPEVIELPLQTARIVGFAEEPDGELYVIDIESGVHRLAVAPAG